MSDLQEQIFSTLGYSSDFSSGSNALAVVRDMVEEQWLSRIDQLYPHLTKKFSQLGIDKYHELAHQVDHGELWKKTLSSVTARRSKKNTSA